MGGLGALGFTAPGLLLALLALPLLWLILRAVPPAPIRRRFPGVALLLGLEDDEAQSDRTPWWLLALRLVALGLVILGFAGPVLNPDRTEPGQGPLLILLDGTWADARDWPQRIDRVEAALREAARQERPVAVVSLTDLPGGALPFQAAEAWISRLPSVTPQPWAPDAAAVTAWAAGLPDGGFDTLWLSDGLARPERAPLLQLFEARGALRLFESPRPPWALHPARYDEGLVRLRLSRAADRGPSDFALIARGLDPAGQPRDLARLEGAFAPGALAAELDLSLPAELRNRVTRFAVEGVRSAGAVSLTDDALRRREVALLAGRGGEESFELLSPLHYLREALAPNADLIEAELADLLPANPDVIILADVARLGPGESADLLAWAEAGGLLVRFAGPRLAASDVSRDEEDPLMPVRLRHGGRSVGGAMSWGAPKRLRAFEEGSPFFGLPVSDEVVVSAQVLAQPDPDLGLRTIAALSDGTPLVTRKPIGEGAVILFHVTANAEWSSLPLSGLFVQMLDRLAISTRPAALEAGQLEGTTWVAESLLDGFGQSIEAGQLGGLPGAALAEGALGPQMPPGLYRDGGRSIALNVTREETVLAPMIWPPRIVIEGLDVVRETPLKGAVLSAALILLLADLIASLWLSGKLPGLRPGAWAAALALLLALPWGQGQAQTEAQTALQTETQTDSPPAAAPVDAATAIAATSEVRLAYVETGDGRLDEVTRAGLMGLSDVLYARTSIEPADPIAVAIERDELSFYPLLYWAVSPDQPLPSPDAYAKLNRYLRTGGMILFDTRDGDVAGFGGASRESRRLQQIALGLDIPPLEPVPGDHVLTRAFYLIQDFPGRYNGGALWVEAAPADAAAADGMPFRNLNDGVTPVVIGGNDWAAAWAVDGARRPMFRVGAGLAGERQREIAYRFGVNLVMHVLTGNYKSDQVHVPALLDRLGN